MFPSLLVLVAATLALPAGAQRVGPNESWTAWAAHAASPTTHAVVAAASASDTPQPVLSVRPMALVDSLAPGDSTTHALLVHNPGTATLSFEIRTETSDSTGQSLTGAAASSAAGSGKWWPRQQAWRSPPAATSRAAAMPRAGTYLSELPASFRQLEQLLLTFRAPGQNNRLLFDSFHCRTWNPSTIFSSLAAELAQQGYVIAESDTALQESLLTEVQVLVISSPDRPYSAMELAAVERFVRRGGGLFLIGEIAGPWLSPAALGSLAGLFGAAYEPLTVLTGELSFTGPHPILENVHDIDIVASASALASVPHTLATLGNRPVLGWTRAGQGKVVFFSDCNIFDDQEGFLYALDHLQLASNIAGWLAVPAGVPWLAVEPAFGEVAPGDSLMVQVQISARGLERGTCAATLHFLSNAPEQSSLHVPVQLTVTGAPQLTLSAAELSFGEVFLGYTDSLTLTVGNSGHGLLRVSLNGPDHPAFSMLEESLVLAPGDSQHLVVWFRPTHAGASTGTLLLRHNATDSGVTQVQLSGMGVVPPALVVVPDSLTDSLFTGGHAQRFFAIHNRGGSPLRFTLSERPWQLTLTRSGPSAGPVRLLTGQSQPQEREQRAAAALALPAVQGAGRDALTRLLASVPDSVRVFYDDMEHGGNGWTTIVYENGWDDLWHQTLRQHNSPTHSWWCGVESQGNYRTGNRINTALLSPIIDLRAWPAPLTLQFFENYMLEEGFDFAMVEAAVEGGNNWIPLRGTAAAGTAATGSSNGWVATLLDLSPFTGHRLQLRFYFDTRDNIANNFGGWHIDDVLVYSAGIPWLTAEPKQGEVAPGDTLNVRVDLDATGLEEGEQLAALVVSSNDPFRPAPVLPVHLHITAGPDLQLANDSLNFGSLFTGFAETLAVAISNIGVAPLRVDSVRVTSPAFQVLAPPRQLAPGESRELVVRFAPVDSGRQEAQCLIASNDPDEPRRALRLSGRGVVAPQAALVPDSLEMTLTSGDSLYQVHLLDNLGGSDLWYEIVASEKECSPAAGAAHRLAASSVKRILFDTSHGINPPGFGLEIYSRLISLLRDMGHLVVTAQPAFDPAGFDVVVLIRPATPFTTSQIHALQNSVAAGARLVMLGDWGGGFGEPWLNQILKHNRWHTGMAINYDVVRDPVFNLSGRSAFLKIFTFPEKSSPFVARVDTALMLSAASLTVKSPARVLAASSPFAEIGLPSTGASLLPAETAADATSQLQPHISGSVLPVMAACEWGRGNIVVCSDSDFLADSSMADGVAVGLQRFDNLQLAINLLTSGGVSWLAIAPTAGVVPPAGRVELKATVRTEGLLGGDYCANLALHTNDPFQPTRELPVQLHVIGLPGMAVARDTLDFGEVYLGFPDSLALLLSNPGTAPLRVNSITSTDSQFVAMPNDFFLAPGISTIVTVVFTPATPGAVTARLTIHSNAADRPQREVWLRAQTLRPPGITVAPDSVCEELFTGQHRQRTLVLTNNGGSELQYHVQVEGSTGLVLSHGRNHEIPGRQSSPFESFQALHDLFDNAWLDGGNDAFDGFGNPEVSAGSATQVFSMVPGVQQITVNGRTLEIRKDFPENHVYRMIIASGSEDPEPDSEVTVRLRGNMGADATTATVVRALDIEGQTCTYMVCNDAGGIQAGDPQVLFLMLPADPAQQHAVRYQSTLDNISLTAVNVRLPVMVYLIVSYYPLEALEQWLAAELHYDPAFMQIAPTSGTVMPGANATLDLTLDATGLVGREYAAAVHLSSNAPAQHVITVPVHLQVTGAPDLVVLTDSLHFERVFAGFRDSLALVMRNNGTDTLFVSEISSNTPLFSCSPVQFALAARREQIAQVTFAPREAGAFSGRLQVHSNDVDDQKLEIKVSGTAVLPPRLTAQPGHLQEALFPDESATHTLWIKNTGGSDLDLHLETLPVAGMPAEASTAEASGTEGSNSKPGDWSKEEWEERKALGLLDGATSGIQSKGPWDFSHSLPENERGAGMAAWPAGIKHRDDQRKTAIAPTGQSGAVVSWLKVQPNEGHVPAGDSLAIAVTFATNGLTSDSTYAAQLLLHSNDPMQPQLALPCTLAVFRPDSAEILLLDRRGSRQLMLTNLSTDTLALYVRDVLPLGAYEVEIEFDPGFLQMEGVRQGAFLGSTGREVLPVVPVIDNRGGRLRFGAASVGEAHGPAGEGELAQIIISTRIQPDSCSAPVLTSLRFTAAQLVRTSGQLLRHRQQPADVDIRCDYWADLDGDGDVDIVDIQLGAARWNTRRGEPMYLARGDVDGCGAGDGDIDIVDLQLLVSQFGRSGPPWPPCEAAPPGVPLPAPEEQEPVALRFERQHVPGESQMIFLLSYIGGGPLPAALEVDLELEAGDRLVHSQLNDKLHGNLVGPSMAAKEQPVRLGAFGLDADGIVGTPSALVTLQVRGDRLVLQGLKGYGKEGRPVPIQLMDASKDDDLPPEMPDKFVLYPNYPNPFTNSSLHPAGLNTRTTIRFDIPAHEGHLPVQLAIYDLQGKLVQTIIKGERPPGSHLAQWQGHDGAGRAVASGIYFVRLEAGSFLAQRKVMVVR